MHCAWMVGPMLAVALGACTAQPGSDDATSSASTPAGFDVWLAEQCPDGAALEVGEPGHVIACESVRERAVADPVVRSRLVEVYMGRATEQDVGEARERLSPLGGLLCAVMAATPAMFATGPTADVACRSPQLTPDEQARCSDVTGGGSIALGILCALAAFF